MLRLICNIIKMSIQTEEKPYGKSIHTGEEPYIYDASLKSQFTKVTTCQIYWLKLTILFTETLGHKVIANSMLKSSLFVLFIKRATFIL